MNSSNSINHFAEGIPYYLRKAGDKYVIKSRGFLFTAERAVRVEWGWFRNFGVYDCCVDGDLFEILFSEGNEIRVARKGFEIYSIKLEGGRREFERGGYQVSSWGTYFQCDLICLYGGEAIFTLEDISIGKFLRSGGWDIFLNFVRMFEFQGNLLSGFTPLRDFHVLFYCVLFMDYHQSNLPH